MSWFGRVFGKLITKKSKYITPGLEEGTKSDEPLSDEAEQEQRRACSEVRLRGEGVPINPDLPIIKSSSQIEIRPRREVADRLLALTLVAMKGEGMDNDVIQEIVRERDAAHLFTPEERAFIDNPAPDESELALFTRRYEAAWTLVWALRLVREPLSTPREPCDVARLIEIVRDTPQLAARALRRPDQILDKLDLFIGYDWAVRKAISQGCRMPADLNADVTLERCHALCWLACMDGHENWEDAKLAA